MTDPAIIVIFGITGDLAQRYLLPSLYHLIKDDMLHEQTVIVGVTRQNTTVDELLAKVELCVNEVDGVCDPEGVRKVRERLRMVQMDVTKSEDYDTLLKQLNEIEDEHGLCMNRLYYLSIPPQVFGPIVRFLGEHGLNKSCPHNVAATRLLVEKPFGYDLASGRELIEETAKHFNETQVYRIDHYLAKSMVQSFLTFRQTNQDFQARWDAKAVSSIQITAAEKIGIEGRVNFYEQTGALRDFVQSHMLQLLAVATMDLPKEATSDATHTERLKLLEAIKPVAADHVNELAVRGQYHGYREDVKNPDSTVETFVALRLEIDNERWRGVPILLRTGKALAERLTEIKVIFKADAAGKRDDLSFHIQPNENTYLNGEVLGERGHETPRKEGEVSHPTAYERVLMDAVRGDHTLFASSQEVLTSWRIIQPLLEAWQHNADNLIEYEQGSWGPEAAAAWFDSAPVADA